VACDLAQVAPEEELRELLGDFGEGLQLLNGRVAPLLAARAQRGRDELLQETGLAVRRCAEGAQVTRGDPEARELRAGDRDVDVPGGVELLASLSARLQKAVLLELPRQLARDGRLLAQLAEVELVVGGGAAARGASPTVRRRRRSLPAPEGEASS
jgi:hypothetical protein